MSIRLRPLAILRMGTILFPGAMMAEMLAMRELLERMSLSRESMRVRGKSMRVWTLPLLVMARKLVWTMSQVTMSGSLNRRRSGSLNRRRYRKVPSLQRRWGRLVRKPVRKPGPRILYC